MACPPRTFPFASARSKLISAAKSGISAITNTAKRHLLDKGLCYILECCRTLFQFAAKRRHLPPYAENPFSALEIATTTSAVRRAKAALRGWNSFWRAAR